MISGYDLIISGHDDVKILQQAVVNAINPAMHGQFLPACPGVLNNGRLTDVDNLLDHIQLAEFVASPRFIADQAQRRFVFLAHLLYVAQPVVDQSEPAAAQRRQHAAAAVMPADNDVFHPQHVDGKLHHRQTIQIRMDDEIGNIAMDEQLSRHQADDLIGGHPTVGTADPQISGRLLTG